MLSKKLESTLHNALNLATEKGHEYATLEHLLHALTADDDARAVLRACGVDITILQDSLNTYLDEELDDLKGEKVSESKPTTGFQRVLQRAAIHVQSSGREEVTGANVLIALFSERESHAVFEWIVVGQRYYHPRASHSRPLQQQETLLQETPLR